VSVSLQNNLVSNKSLGRFSTRRHLQFFLFVVVLTIIGILTNKNSAFASNAGLWHTVERINGFGSGNVPFPKSSSGGRYVVFHSQIDSLVPNDSNNFCDTDGNGVADNSCADIFVYDRETRSTTLVSVSSAGTQGNQRSSHPSISPDARYITFQSEAYNLVPDGVHTCLYYRAIFRQCTDIFVHDRNYETTERVSIASDATKANGNSSSQTISAEGRYVAFSSDASNLIPNGTHVCRDSISSFQCNHIFIHDRSTGITERVSVASNGEKGNNGSHYPSISADGRHVVFLSSATNLAPNDNNRMLDAFVRHLDTNQTEIVSIASDGTQGSQGVEFIAPAISADGRYVAFVSRSTNLVANDTNNVTDVFVHDLYTGTTIRASVATNASQANDTSGTYHRPSISSDGRYVFYDSWATNLVTNDTNGAVDIFVRDLQLNTTVRVSVAQDGSQANHISSFGAISPDGDFASFISYANNLIPGDLNNTGDIFVAEASTAHTFPYFSQKDPNWGGQEYDHAESIGPFFCGTTIAGCGCAITSSAMLLKYYGVNKSPTGDPTNPQTLNNWLKANNGYAFGALKWNSIAAYSVKANAVYHTQKIKFSGVAPAGDFTTLKADLNNNSPPILQEPGHFIAATGIQSLTYSIADPAWENRTTLQSYGNAFKSMRRFAKTSTDLSAIYIATVAPTELLITDSQGRKTGKDAAGNIYNQIPDSYYALEPAFLDQSSGNPQAPPENLGVNTLLILTPDKQNFTLQTFTESPTYSIEFSGYDEDGDMTVQGFDQTSADQYDIDYTESGNHFEFFQTVEIDARHASKSNPFNPKARILPLSILASENFDPQSIDINTIDAGPNWNLLKTSSILVGPRSENGKSLLLLLENRGNYEEEICISGKTLNGVPFRGCDAITVAGNSP